MLALWMFGSDLERHWGTRAFVRFFFICGIGAGLTTVLVDSLFPPRFALPTVGASGAIFGILLAYGLLFPNRIIYYLIFPIPARWFVVLVGGMAFLGSFNRASGIANVAHLGGLAVGFLYLKAGRLGDIRWRYDRWRRNRLRRNFEVFYNDRDRDEPPKWRRWK
jgi:membrane associated rhomboid family serine protease